MSEITTVVKKTTRARKTATVSDQVATDISLSAKTLKPMEDAFAKLANTIATARDEYGELQKQIAEIKETWDKEQKLHIIKIQERDKQEEIEKRREQELYAYEVRLKRRQEEDEFTEKKLRWEKELQSQKDEIAKEKQELEMLRKQVAGFEGEKEKSIRQACVMLEKDLTDQYSGEKRLREQEVKSEQEMLALKIANLTSENTRLTNEVVMLKKSLDEATVQLKEVAVKVIESSGNKPQVNATQES